MLKSWILLNELPHVTPLRIQQLVAHFGSADAAVAARPAALAAASGQPVANFEPLQSSQAQAQADEIMRRSDALGSQILTPESPEYPAALREIDAPPPVLFVRGNVAAFAACAVGFVGTRRASVYGKNVVNALVAPLVEKRCVIVSGLAQGIDTLAHRQCLEKNGTTIAVLGTGLDIIYPRSNQELAEAIAANGALVSEFTPGMPALPYNFPRRNRIISGLSAGVVVVEAGAKSGSLITAAYALQQNRDVFAVPGSIFSEFSAGTLRLIKNGAIPVQSAADILEHLSGAPRLALASGSPKPTTRIQEELLCGDEQTLAQILAERPLRIDELTEKTGQDMATVFQVLLGLELKGCIKQLPGQLYSRS